MTASLDRAYDAFLNSCDLATWSACLEEYAGAGVAGTPAPRPQDLRRALTLATYVAWLARCEADAAAGARAESHRQALEARVQAEPAADPHEAVLIAAVGAAARGYRATARRMVDALAEPLPVELAVLTAPSRRALKAGRLRPYVLSAGATPFMPAVCLYGDALLELGYLGDAAAVAARHRGATPCAPWIDLQGQLHELAADWRRAREAYAASPWALHGYRAMVCGLILGEPVEHLAGWPAEQAARFCTGMDDFGGEADRAAIVRSESFVRACRWNGFDNWLVRFELGRLGFQRRRHAEAERHLAAATRTAPPAYRSPILSLRFTNLTWLGDEFELDLTPEALEAGHAALQQMPADRSAFIRTWLSGQGGERGLLGPVLEGSDRYHAGIAHAQQGNTPAAAAAWSACLAESHVPRAHFELLKAFAAAGFGQTASRFAEAVEREAEDGFFDLWELADALAACSAGDGPLGAILARVQARLQMLVQADFQHAIRAFQHFHRQAQPEPAARMLTQAERLAEGPEELLRLAIARRRAAGGEMDAAALQALRRAEPQSSDRLERLLIAREFAHQGQLTEARSLLAGEGVLAGAQDLTPAEHLLAIDVAGRCSVGDAASQAIAQAAVATLRRDADAGRFLRFGQRFADRLDRLLDRSLAMPELQDAAAQAAEGEASSWSAFVAQVERTAQDDQVLRLLQSKVGSLGAAPSIPEALEIWRLHHERLDALVRAIRRRRPVVPDDRVPLACDDTPTRPRAQRLARLWRRTLLAGDDASEVRAFFEEEAHLTQDWLARRRRETLEPAAQAGQYAAECARLLYAMEATARRAEPWPAFLEIAAAFAADTRDLAQGLVDRAGDALPEAAA
ncbi:MAG TPA: hypothetical protein VGN83_17760 [Falsiroseomonas sp.]|jgi:hypothetical protein|nr:hypothetical protein [Falsiroseomonas sp.]